jgi:hypothetical protein
MQSFRILGALAAGAVFVSGAAFAQPAPFRAEATLATPVGAPTDSVVGGVNWRCEADKCVGTAERYSTLDSPVKECRKVVATIGEVTDYRTRGRVLTKGTLGVCNTAVADKGGVAQTAQK